MHDLVSAAGHGGRTELESLFGRHLAPLQAFVRLKLGARLAARESAHDIAQSVCREAVEAMPRFEFRSDDAFRNWLLVRAVRKIADRHRFYHAEKRDIDREAEPCRNDQDPLRAEDLATCYASLVTPSRHAGAREEVERIEAALAELPERQREAVAMSRMMGIDTRDVADHLDMTESAVRGLVARGPRPPGDTARRRRIPWLSATRAAPMGGGLAPSAPRRIAIWSNASSRI